MALRILAVCFFLSGFASLLYQTVWLRLAMARFGVNAPVISAVLSVFMLGLAAGSYGGGRLSARAKTHALFRGLRAYALLELWIAIGGMTVPYVITYGRAALLALPMSDPVRYFSASFVVILIGLFPFCLAMGATYPFALSFLKTQTLPGSKTHFSYLYLVNVAGSLAGVIVPAFFTIELWGFTRTLWLAVCANLLAALAAYVYAIAGKTEEDSPHATGERPDRSAPQPDRTVLGLLFCLGFCSLGLEVVWTRVFTPYAGTSVYAFAMILIAYFSFTTAGTNLYRWYARRAERNMIPVLWPLLIPAVWITLFTCRPDLPWPGGVRVLIGVAPISLITGMLTPALIDRTCESDPRGAGVAYAANLTGCIAGPLMTGFLLIPAFGNRIACYVLALPFLVTAFVLIRNKHGALCRRGSLYARFVWVLAGLLSLAFALFERPYESRYPGGQILHDHTATVIAAGQGLDKKLVINGVHTTYLTSVTKMMVHLPAAHFSGSPKRGLVICLGMGTSFRSMASWGMRTTAVELVPSVARLVPYFHDDISPLLTSKTPVADIVVDDGRRYLDRRSETFDVITIDPPPPIEAAASSLLYSVEFYESARRRLNDGGILQAWFPGGDPETLAGITEALRTSFPYLRIFVSAEGWGLHYLASMRPIPVRNAAQLAARLPDRAARDLLEWMSQADTEAVFQRILDSEIDVDTLSAMYRAGSVVTLTDDRPVNEYFLVRRARRPL